MTGPRKRTSRIRGAASLVAAILLVGGTVNSSEAAKKKSRSAEKNHSTSVKKQQKSTRSNHVVSSKQQTQAKARRVVLTKAAPKVAAKPKAAPAPTRTVSREPSKKSLRVAQTPRAIAIKRRSTRSSSRSASAPARHEAAEVREALARRRAWTDPRSSFIEPAQVQDPPARPEVDRPAVEASELVTGPARQAPEGVMMARRNPYDAEATNEDLIREALRNRGKPYVWGGASRGGFDCSGFVLYVFRKKRGIMLPHSASAQARHGVPVAKEELQAGDLVFFSTYRRSISHVGIYVGDNKFVHAANTRRDVRVDSLSGYYASRYRGARRLTPTPIRFSPEELQELFLNSSETPAGTGM